MSATYSGIDQIERRKREPALGSDAVRDFYERLPYPAPLSSLDEYVEMPAKAERRRALFHRMWPTKRPSANQQILIAGCGTSQAARYALSEPGAWVTAIDISAASLRHTGILQRRYDLDNLELHELPIERVQELGRTFDLIVCTGVLHHLADPDLGLRALREVLRATGAMSLMVYATYGRAGIYLMQKYCRLLGMAPPTGTCKNSARASVRCRRITRSPICFDERRISGAPTRWPTLCCIRRIAPTPSRSCTPGSSAAVCPSVAGSSRRPTSRSAVHWPDLPTPRGSLRFPRTHSTRLRNCFAAR